MHYIPGTGVGGGQTGGNVTRFFNFCLLSWTCNNNEEPQVINWLCAKCCETPREAPDHAREEDSGHAIEDGGIEDVRKAIIRIFRR